LETKPLAFVIDDDASLGILFKTALEIYGFEVERIDDSRFAMEKIINLKPRLIMLDMQMPRVSGLDILRAVRADERLTGIKIIMVTANAQASYDTTIDALVDLLLIKPVSLKQISDFASRMISSAY
jgi:DNA-binding response OmpR family regulator